MGISSKYASAPTVRVGPPVAGLDAASLAAPGRPAVPCSGRAMVTSAGGPVGISAPRPLPSPRFCAGIAVPRLLRMTRHAGPGTSGSGAAAGRALAVPSCQPARLPGELPGPGMPVSPAGVVRFHWAVPAPGQSPACSGWLSIHRGSGHGGRAWFPLAGTDVSRETGQNFALRSASGQRARWHVGFSAWLPSHPVTAGGVETAADQDRLGLLRKAISLAASRYATAPLEPGS